MHNFFSYYKNSCTTCRERHGTMFWYVKLTFSCLQASFKIYASTNFLQLSRDIPRRATSVSHLPDSKQYVITTYLIFSTTQLKHCQISLRPQGRIWTGQILIGIQG